MSNRAKNILYSLLLIAAVLIVMRIRNGKKQPPLRLEGKTMGTTYHVTYFDPQNRNFQTQVDSILALVNRSISTWDSLSEISRFNRADKGIALELPYFYPPLQTSRIVYEGSGGAYDPTVMPLVNAWGFG
ncbi:MAG: FAD:protein FMN transferase, partial [Bacteroidota bacterium]